MDFSLAKILAFLALATLAGLAYRQRKPGLVIWLTLLTGLFLFTGKVGFLVFAIILASLLLGLPLFVLMGGIGVMCIGLLTSDDLPVAVRKVLELAGKEVLLAIPFFVVAGELMTQGTLARRLIDFMRAAFGWIPGGLAVSAVAGCVFFAAISGSSPVTVVAIGSIMVPALLKASYPKDFSVGLLTTAGSLGILIPPSIPMIIYSIMVSGSTPVDPTELFIAGIGPGLFIGALLAGYAVTQGLRFKIPREPFSKARLWDATREGFWSLMLPVIILGGIYTGVFTATEASAVSVVYALAVEVFIHGEMDRKKLLSVAENSMTVMGSLLVIIALALTLNYVLVDQEIPERMVQLLKEQNLSRVGFLVFVNILLLIVGMFMDIMSAILIIAPMLAPMAAAVGIDPIHMGIIFIVNLEIGYLTPPVGLNLFVSSTLFKESIGFVIRAVVPTLVIMLVALGVVSYVPELATGLVVALRNEPKVEAPATPALKVDAPPEPGERSLQDLMRQKKAAEDAGEAGAEKSLQELMREAKEKGTGDDAPPAQEKSLQDLMREAKEKGSDPTPPAQEKSLQDLMREAKEKAPKDADAPPAGDGG
ncbi:MAG: TRAP transporter large permease subunit [Myxococcaceae bacterium]|nr:TRAP transporter large permease subunit [Myxococcaceae bacterium]